MIVVVPKSITVRTESATRVYDGTPLTAESACEEGLVEGDSFEVTGTQTDVGSSPNTYSILPDGAAVNYSITQSIGTLRVTPKRTATNLRLSQSGSSATATAVVSGFVDGEETAGTVQFSVGNSTQSVEVARNEAGEYVAETTFESVPTNNYTVTATFSPESSNYLQSTATATGHKDPTQRTIVGTRLHQKTYGDAGFPLDLSVSEDAQDTDEWSYAIIYDSRNIEALGLGDSISLPASTNLLPSYLETLDTGSHTLATEFDDGEAVAVEFTVREAGAAGGGESSNVPSGNGDAGGSTGRLAERPLLKLATTRLRHRSSPSCLA